MKKMSRKKMREYRKVGTKIAEREFVRLGTREEKIARELFSEERAYYQKIRNRIPEIIDLYYVKKLAFKKVAKEIGIDHKTLKGWMNLFGLPRASIWKRRGRKTKPSRRFFYPSPKKMAEYKKIGRKVSREWKVRLGSEEERVMKEVRADKSPFMEKLKSLEPRILDLYYKQGLSLEKVAKKLKIHETTLRNYMGYLGLPSMYARPEYMKELKSKMKKKRRKRKKKVELTEEEKVIRQIEAEKKSSVISEWFPRYRKVFKKDKIVRDAVRELRKGADPNELVREISGKYKIFEELALDKVKMAVKIIIYNIDGSKAASA